MVVDVVAFRSLHMVSGWLVEAGDFLLPWLLHITMYELCERPCCAPFRVSKPGS